MSKFQNENNIPDADRDRNLPMAPIPSDLDDDEGIFMNWPGTEDGMSDTAQSDGDCTDGLDGAVTDGISKDDKNGTDDTHAEYAFRRAAKSDSEESQKKKKKKKQQEEHDETDNEATLSSIKYYKYTRKLKQLVFHRFLPLSLALILIVGFVLYFFRLQHLNFVNLSGYPAEDVFAATGIKKNDFIFTVSSFDIEKKLRTKFPYIQSVEVELDLPDTVSLIFEEDCALFYTQIYDEYFVISESMRVLARYDSVDELEPGLRAVKLPAVSWAVVGHPLRFFDTSYLSFLRSFLSEMEVADIYPQITSMDISNRFDLIITYEDRLEIFLGNDTYLTSNLSFVKSIVEKLDDDDIGEINIIDNKTASFSAAAKQ